MHRPLVVGAADIRGLWIGVQGDLVGHVERVEQCGHRTVITSSGIIHDAGPNSTLGENSNDTQGAVLFTAKAGPRAVRSSRRCVVPWSPIHRSWRET